MRAGVGWIARVLLMVALPVAGWGQAPSAADRGGQGNALAKEERSGYGNVGYAKISGLINRLRFRYLQRVIEDAKSQGLDTVVVHIDTDGGEVYYARQMFKLILDQERDGPLMVAYVDFRAISAGAMIAYAHDAIYIMETASIGDIGVIFQAPGGEMKYAPEKVETVVRTLLVQAAEQRGWSKGLLLKMTARNQNLYRVTHKDGSHVYVIQDDLPDFLARHPDIDEENDQQVIIYRGEDRLLTLTGLEASKLGMATALVEDLEGVYRQLDIEPDSVTDMSPLGVERTAWLLSGVAPLLAGLAFLFVLFELKTPGVGLFAILGLICGGLFLVSQYYLDMAENVEVVLIALGIVLLAVEFFTLIGGGLIGLAGGGLAFTGLVLSFLPNEFEYDFSDGLFQDALTDAALSSLFSVAVLAVGMIAFIYLIPRSALRHRLAVTASVTATSAGALEASTAELVGRLGSASQALRPSGTITLDGQAFSARVEHGIYLDAGQVVEVIRVEFGELVVRGVDSDSAGKTESDPPQ